MGNYGFGATCIVTAFFGVAAAYAASHEFSTTVHLVSSDGQGKAVGTVVFRDSDYGLIIEPDLQGLEPGPLALHVHENPSCEPGADGTPAGGAGDHYDPAGRGMHAGPYRDGHLGDLPNILVENNGEAHIPVLAPRVKAIDVDGRALIIHAGADRYDGHADHEHGTGGSRMYCGVIG